MPNGAGAGAAGIKDDNSRPVSAATDRSFDFMNRPMSGPGAGLDHVQIGRAMTALSRTDQIVLRHFWEEKYADNAKRDLHFVSDDASCLSCDESEVLGRVQQERFIERGFGLRRRPVQS